MEDPIFLQNPRMHVLCPRVSLQAMNMMNQIFDIFVFLRQQDWEFGILFERRKLQTTSHPDISGLLVDVRIMRSQLVFLLTQFFPSTWLTNFSLYQLPSFLAESFHLDGLNDFFLGEVKLALSVL